jgi:hypothetical protein
MKLRIADRLGVLFDPRFWVRNDPVCHDYSDELERQLASGAVPVRRCEYTHTLNGVVIWTGNWPYGFGNIYKGKASGDLPRRKVAIALKWLISLPHRAYAPAWPTQEQGETDQ